MQLSHKNICIWVSFLQSTKENHSCALVFDNFCCLINLKIATNNLSETNSFLPLKAVFCSSTRYLLLPPSSKLWHSCSSSVNWFSSWTHQKTTEGEKNSFFSSYLVRWINSLKRSAKCQEQWEVQWLRLLLLQQQSVKLRSHQTVLISIYPRMTMIIPITIQSTYINNTDFF